MPFSDLTPNSLQVGLGSAPRLLSSTDLRRVFVELARFAFDTYATLPDGGASVGDAGRTRELVVQSAQRILTTTVALSTSQQIDEALDVFSVVEARLPATYLLWQATITSHQPVTGETARALLDRTLFPGRAPAFERLGPNRLGTGIRTILSDGHGRLTVEPLVTRPDALFVHTP